MPSEHRAGIALSLMALGVAVGAIVGGERDMSDEVVGVLAILAVSLFLAGMGLLTIPYLGIVRLLFPRWRLFADYPVLKDIEHRLGCPQRLHRMEPSTTIAEDGCEVRSGRCLDCGEGAYRRTTRPRV